MKSSYAPPQSVRKPYFKLLTRSQLHAASQDFQNAASIIFQILFSSGSDVLTELDKRRLAVLAEYLQLNTKLLVNLAGHTDPKGTDEYNYILSIERAKAVKDEFIAHGIHPSRISFSWHGSDFSVAEMKDYEAYRLERRVDIEIGIELKT